jgi:CheY-like chemotaxis protein
MAESGHPAEGSHLTLHLLMVEDRPEDYARIVRELGRGDLRITPIRVDSEAGLVEALERQPPDLVLCDHGGIAYDSFSALRRVRAVSPDVPFIVVTGRPGQELMRQVLAEGADEWISKDRLPELLPAVLRALRLAGERRRTRRLEEERENLRAELLRQRGSRPPQTGVEG